MNDKTKKLESIENNNTKIARILFRFLSNKHSSRKLVQEAYDLTELQSIEIADLIDEVSK